MVFLHHGLEQKVCCCNLVLVPRGVISVWELVPHDVVVLALAHRSDYEADEQEMHYNAVSVQVLNNGKPELPLVLHKDSNAPLH